MVDRYKQYYCSPVRIPSSRLIYDDGFLKIQGLERSGSVLIDFIFEDVLLVRIADEGIRLKLQKDIGFNQAIIFLDRQSDLPGWLRQECLCTHDFDNANHYVLFIGEEVFDVVALSEPLISEAPIHPK